MNYPLWEIPAAGLLIAFVAIIHVFVSHFAVGGGLFLVLTEQKARRENDAELLDYVKRHSRFFILLTLVFGAVTGVGIWFTIGLVHPAATAALINTFVWGWAIEWTFFVTEIAAAIVYYYGWERLSPKLHMAIGWIYFGSALASLVVINGILTFMLTPGSWIETHSFWGGFFNPTYWPALFIRTLGAMGLAGIYALFTASWMNMTPDLQRKIARYAALGWVLPMAIGLPIGLVWFFDAAASAGVPVAEIFGIGSAQAGDLLQAVFGSSATGHPIAHRALRTAFFAITLMIVLTFLLMAFQRLRISRIATALLMISGLASIGGAEWVREDLRKPYVIGSHMYVTGERIPLEDTRSVMQRAKWVRSDDHGREVFRLLCSECHTVDGYLAIRNLVRGKSSASIESMLEHIETWRGRRMPPFAGNADDRYAVSVYLARLGGGPVTPRTSAISGSSVFESSCAMCHGPEGDFPIATRVAGKSESELYDIVGRLPDVNPMMPPFDGSDTERRALAQYLAGRK